MLRGGSLFLLCKFRPDSGAGLPCLPVLILILANQRICAVPVLDLRKGKGLIGQHRKKAVGDLCGSNLRKVGGTVSP